jgi:hypothetical protein
MSSSEGDVNKIKRSILLRYPFTFYEEVSRALIIFKTLRGNKQILRALPVLNELIDYVNIDPITGKHPFEMTEEEKKAIRYDLIDLPEEAVSTFKRLWNGSDEDDYDGILGLKHLSPGKSVDSSKPTVFIRKPIPFLEAYGDHPAAWIAFIAGISYQVTEINQNGFPITQIVPMVDMSSDDIQATFTHQIPYVVWSTMYERMWAEMAPVCTRIERVIAKALSDKGFSEGTMQLVKSDDDNDEDSLML